MPSRAVASWLQSSRPLSPLALRWGPLFDSLETKVLFWASALALLLASFLAVMTARVTPVTDTLD